MRNDAILNLAEQILKEEEEFLVPISKLRELILQEKESWTIELSELIKLLSEDNLFYLLDSQSTQEPWEEDDDELMEKLGFYKGPRVILYERMPDKEEMEQTIKEKMQDVLHNLKQAYKVSAGSMEDSEEEEFLKIMAKAKDLSKKIEEVNEN
jgi:hypothetical protein